MLVRRIERLGCVVIRLPVNETGIDAFSVPYSDRPIIVLGSDNEAFDRYRWNAAHELGHLVIHGQLKSEPTKEQETHADRFAAALLMPSTEVRFLLPRYVDWSVFLGLKRDWGVSIAALINRAHQLELLTDAQRTRAFKTMSYRGWRKQEPVDLGPPESPSLLELAVQATIETQGIDQRGVARMARLAAEDVERLVSGTKHSRPVVAIPLDDKSRSGISSTHDDVRRRQSDAI
jgi:Zn-dependent peptidase ImmA (M78 family)